MSRVLIVEDDPHLVHAIARALAGSYATVEVSSSHEAVRVLAAGGVDVIVADWGLADEDGIALLEWVAYEYPHVRRVLISGTLPDDDAERRLRACDARFVQKPFEMAELFETIK